MSIHSAKRSHCHLAWDSSVHPTRTVKSGDTVSFDCPDASNGQITPASSASDLRSLDLSSPNAVNAPIYIDGAQPGDTLQVDVLEVATAGWGWTGVGLLPGFGLLADEFPEPYLKVWDLPGGAAHAWFDKTKGIRVPLAPFAGIMGVALGEEGPHPPMPPYRTGGNMDTKYLVQGTTLYLPVEVEGALFYVDDGHAAQGDGEVCGSAIETPIKITVRLSVLKDKPYVTTPHFSTSKSHDDPNGHYCTTGVGPDIREATRDAVRHMIAVLGVEHGLAREEAYVLCSVAADLRMHEVVDMPNYFIGIMMPKSIFGNKWE